MTSTHTFDDCTAAVDAIIEHTGARISLGLPLGLGKPNHLVNELVGRAVNGQIEELEIFTALSLAKPVASNPLQRRLMEPISERLYGGYEDLEYVGLRARGELTENIRIHEFYYPPGSLLSNQHAQHHYKSVNYTDAVREILAADVDVIAQLVAPGADGGFDLSCNTDLSVELFPILAERADPPLIVAQVNRNLPAMGGHAQIDEEAFDIVLDAPRYDYDLFCMPSMPPDDGEYLIGLYAASLLRDGGTIQVGIGNLGEAACWAAMLRHRQPEAFRALLEAAGMTAAHERLVEREGGTGPFDKGLYASTEMLVEGIIQLYEAGVLSRRVYDDLDTQLAANRGELDEEARDDGTVAHGAFYLGSDRFYELLRDLDDDARAEIEMTSVRFTNLLFGDEHLKRAQRRDARFVNEGMKVTLLGAVVSDGLDDGQVVSGVGGQFEFVSMANALDDGRSIICIKSTRGRGKSLESNVVFNYGHVTIPRHLRDIIITEYGVADLRGKSDRQIVEALLEVSDSRFQARLAEQAKAAGKLPADYQIPAHARHNTPERLHEAVRPFRDADVVPRCPFGSALDDVELDLVEGLLEIKHLIENLDLHNLSKIDPDDLVDATLPPKEAQPYLERMGLEAPDGVEEYLYRWMVLYGLSAAGHV